MDEIRLRKANDLRQKERDLKNVLDYFKRHEKDKDLIEPLIDYFRSCRNLGSDEIRKFLLAVAYHGILDYLTRSIKQAIEEFEQL